MGIYPEVRAPTLHAFRTQRRRAAIERKEQALGSKMLEVVQLRLEVASLKAQLGEWESWWASWRPGLPSRDFEVQDQWGNRPAEPGVLPSATAVDLELGDNQGEKLLRELLPLVVSPISSVSPAAWNANAPAFTPQAASTCSTLEEEPEEHVDSRSIRPLQLHPAALPTGSWTSCHLWRRGVFLGCLSRSCLSKPMCDGKLVRGNIDQSSRR